MTDPANPHAPSNAPASTAPSLQVDSDWKAQAQAERERLAKQESERSSRHAEQDPEALPPAEFRSLVGLLASQAIMGLGTMGDQQGRVIVDLPGAKFAIDLIDVLQEKTKGNLTAEETQELEEIVRELKSRFLQVARLVTEQMARGQAAPGVAGSPALGGMAPGMGAAPGLPSAGPASTPAKPASSASKLIIP